MTQTTFGGDWTRQKLEILSRYLDAYTTALKNQQFRLIYVDAFAGSGYWNPKSEYAPEDYGDFHEVVKGSASKALDIRDKSFDQLVFIEEDPERSESLKGLSPEHRDIRIINDDANVALPKFCAAMSGRDRAVVFLDPFKTEVSWGTVEIIARTEKIDCWILFPIMAITRMMPVKNEPGHALSAHLDRIFGERRHWRNVYSIPAQLPLFGDEQPRQRESGTEQIADRYRERLESVFKRVAPTRRQLKNSTNTPLFELFFAASNPRGAPKAVGIADHILRYW